MDSRNIELYQEENREILKGLVAGVELLAKSLEDDRHINVVNEIPDTTKVEGSVEITNPQQSVSVDNLEEVKEALKGFADEIKKAIENNSYKPVEVVSIKNSEDLKAKSVEISNISEFKDYLSDVVQAIQDNQPVVNVAKQAIDWPRTAKEAISVRLSDGKSFYTAIANAVASGGGIPVSMTRNSQTAMAVVNPDGTPIGGSSGGLTDAELRATPVEVEGTFYSTTAQYAVIADDVTTGGVVYVGYADPGTATSAASWRIKKIDTSNYPITTWADGNSNFDNVYDNRTSLTYS